MPPNTSKKGDGQRPLQGTGGPKKRRDAGAPSLDQIVLFVKEFEEKIKFLLKNSSDLYAMIQRFGQRQAELLEAFWTAVRNGEQRDKEIKEQIDTLQRAVYSLQESQDSPICLDFNHTDPLLTPIDVGGLSQCVSSEQLRPPLLNHLTFFPSLEEPEQKKQREGSVHARPRVAIPAQNSTTQVASPYDLSSPQPTDERRRPDWSPHEDLLNYPSPPPH